MQFEEFPHFRGGSVSVVGQNIAHDGDAARSISFVEDLLHVPSGELARPFLDRSLNVVLGHPSGTGVGQWDPESCVGVRISSPEAGGDHQSLGDLAPELATLIVDEGFLVLDACPVGMTCHARLLHAESIEFGLNRFSSRFIFRGQTGQRLLPGGTGRVVIS